MNVVRVVCGLHSALPFLAFFSLASVGQTPRRSIPLGNEQWVIPAGKRTPFGFVTSTFWLLCLIFVLAVQSFEHGGPGLSCQADLADLLKGMS